MKNYLKTEKSLNYSVKDLITPCFKISLILKQNSNHISNDINLVVSLAFKQPNVLKIGKYCNFNISQKYFSYILVEIHSVIDA